MYRDNPSYSILSSSRSTDLTSTITSQIVRLLLHTLLSSMKMPITDTTHRMDVYTNDRVRGRDLLSLMKATRTSIILSFFQLMIRNCMLNFERRQSICYSHPMSHSNGVNMFCVKSTMYFVPRTVYYVLCTMYVHLITVYRNFTL